MNLLNYGEKETCIWYESYSLLIGLPNDSKWLSQQGLGFEFWGRKIFTSCTFGVGMYIYGDGRA